MRKLSAWIAAVAVTSVILVGGVAGPAAADPQSVKPERTREGAFDPAGDADSARVPTADEAAATVPSEAWTPTDSRSLDGGADGTARRAPAGTAVGAPGVGEMPWFSFQDFQLSPYSAVRVNLANGNLLAKETDFAIAGPGYALRHDRFYNGLSSLEGSLGGGWQTNNSRDVGLTAGSGYVDYFAPNGVQLRFTRVTGNASEFTSPDGSNLTLVDTQLSPMRYLLTSNKTGEQLWFTASGYALWNSDRNDVGTTSQFTNGAMSSVTHDSGRSLSMTSTGNRVTSVTDSAGREVTYAYDADFRLQTVTAVDGAVTSYAYDSIGRLASITLPAAAAATTTVAFEYDASHRITKVTQQPGVETSFSYAAGETLVTDSNGNTATYTIDVSGRVEATEDALGRSRSQTWTANSDIATSTDALGTVASTYTYDGSNNRISAELPTGAAASAVYAIGPDCGAANTGTAFQPKCSTDDAGNTTEYEYDANGNILKQTNTSGGGSATDFEYTYSGCGGFAGQICTSKDGNGNTTSYAYDTHGNLEQVTPPSPLGTTTYEYDALGRVTLVTDGNGKRTWYDYDQRDRQVYRTFEAIPIDNYLDSTYYPNGLEHTRVDWISGLTTTFEYDHQGRLTRQSGPQTGAEQTYSYDEVGNMLTTTSAGATTAYRYDAANGLVSIQEPGGTCPANGVPAAGSGCVTLEYDDNALESKRTLPGGATTVTARDEAGRPVRITATATGASTPSVDIGYGYAAPGTTDDRANVQTRTAHAEQGIAAGAVTTYTYDSNNRLTLAEEVAGSSVTASWGYQYDGAGNRTQQTRAGTNLGTGATAGTVDYQYNAANQLTFVTGQTTTFTYDGAGNQTRNGLTGITSGFGNRGETQNFGSVAASYNGAGNTDRLALGTTTFTNGALGTVQRAANGQNQTFTRTPTGSPVSMRTTASWYYVHDHLGSVVGLFSSTGSWVGGYSYSPYGETRSASPSPVAGTNPLRYIGGHLDSGSIYKLGTRYYDTNLGRFTQTDPSGQETNPYAYAAGDPINSLDPSGNITIDTFAKLVDALLFGGDIYSLLAAESASDGLSAAFSTACGLIAGAIAAPTVAGIVVAAGGCWILGNLFDAALAESGL